MSDKREDAFDEFVSTMDGVLTEAIKTFNNQNDFEIDHFVYRAFVCPLCGGVEFRSEKKEDGGFYRFCTGEGGFCDFSWEDPDDYKYLQIVCEVSATEL